MSSSESRSDDRRRAPVALIGAIAAAGAMVALMVVGPILWPLESAWISRQATGNGYLFRGVAPIPVLAWLAAGAVLAVAAIVASSRQWRRGDGDRGTTTATVLAIAALAIGVYYHQSTMRRAVDVLASDFRLNEIALSTAGYEDTVQGVPLAYNTDPGGKPLLSWRVHLLPYLEQAALYEQFHLNEPWDSPHNVTLLEKMPAVYRSGTDDAGPGRTRILALTGERTFLAAPNPGQFGQTPPKNVRWNDATRDGATNIVLLVEVRPQLAVEWTKPQDFDLTAPGAYERLFEGVPWVRAAFVDGRVTLLEQRYVTESELKSAAHRDDSDVTNLDF